MGHLVDLDSERHRRKTEFQTWEAGRQALAEALDLYEANGSDPAEVLAAIEAAREAVLARS